VTEPVTEPVPLSARRTGRLAAQEQAMRDRPDAVLVSHRHRHLCDGDPVKLSETDRAAVLYLLDAAERVLTAWDEDDEQEKNDLGDALWASVVRLRSAVDTLARIYR
jgi:L-ascorbate metabolism protein UlaG (beta-lactamase superfamily)